MIDQTAIIDAIERAASLIPEIPGLVKYLPIDGVKACITPVSDPMANGVSSARLNSGNVEATIRTVVESYQQEEKEFGWIVGPNSTPSNLGERLLDSGMKKSADISGMYRSDMTASVSNSHSIRIEELSLDDLSLSIETMSKGFEIPRESAQFYHDILYYSRHVLKSRIYIAFADENELPVSCAFLTYYPDQSFALLGGAATVSDHRGKGIYTGMLARRLADAARDGIQALIVQADNATSAPICAKNRFVKVCDLEIYTGRGQR